VPTVWLTVASMTLASVPRMDCICPNGRTKIFCIGTRFDSPECSEPTSDEGSEQQSHGCCCKRVKPAQVQACQFSTQPSTGGPSVQRNGCTKTFVAPTISSATFSEDDLARSDDLSVSVDHTAPVIIALNVRNQLNLALSQFPITRPPTTDLSILFQHFSN